MKLPRGIRNRNPGNIEISSRFEWIGEVRPSRDKRFASFIDPQHGLRAMMKLIINYQRKHGIDTLEGLVSRWAPSFENNVQAYVKSVADKADITPDAKYDFTDYMFLVPVTKAMVVHENGLPQRAIGNDFLEQGYTENWYSNKVYQDAYEMATKGKIVSHTMNKLPPEQPKLTPDPKKPTLWERFFNWLDKLSCKGE